MNIPRFSEKALKQALKPGHVVVLYGPRQVGKTTLIEKIVSTTNEASLILDGEDPNTQQIFSDATIANLKANFNHLSLLVIDEAQKITHIGSKLKLIVDHLKHLKIIATGSSSFDLAQLVGQPLTGRKTTFKLYPISQIEASGLLKPHETKFKLEETLIYGSYPKIFTTASHHQKRKHLEEITSSHLYKDLLELEGIKRSKKLLNILKLLAFQIGQQVSLSQIGNNTDLNKNTVARYLDLLEQSFVLINIRGFSRNLRKEITKTSRYYFWDNGIRNTLINNFNSINLRDDVGKLWENFIIIERLKKQEYHQIYSNNYFWRTHDKKEIDWIEERDGKLLGFEIKYRPKKVKPPKLWLDTYENATFKVITPENYLDFIT